MFNSILREGRELYKARVAGQGGSDEAGALPVGAAPSHGGGAATGARAGRTAGGGGVRQLRPGPGGGRIAGGGDTGSGRRAELASRAAAWSGGDLYPLRGGALPPIHGADRRLAARADAMGGDAARLRGGVLRGPGRGPTGGRRVT